MFKLVNAAQATLGPRSSASPSAAASVRYRGRDRPLAFGAANLLGLAGADAGFLVKRRFSAHRALGSIWLDVSLRAIRHLLTRRHLRIIRQYRSAQNQHQSAMDTLQSSSAFFGWQAGGAAWPTGDRRKSTCQR